MKYLLTFIMILTAHVSYASVKIAPEANLYNNKSVIAVDKIIPLIIEQIHSNGVEGDLKITTSFNNGIILKNNADSYEVDISDFEVDRKYSKFTAVISFNSATTETEEVTVTGKYSEMVELPVIGSKLPHGSIITENDITWGIFEKNKLKNDVITSKEQLVGQILKRNLRPMTAINSDDIEKKPVILKNDVVDMIYQTSNMELKTVGIAQEDGAVGDIIKVKNKDSNSIIQAVIKNNKLVHAIAAGR